MRVLYLSQYFPPEIGATQTRAHEMARHLVREGHRVTVVTEVPNHPTGVVPPEHRGYLWRRGRVDGIDVIRVWVRASPRRDLRSRMTTYASFTATATFAGLVLARGGFDVIVATSPPLPVGAAGIALSCLRRTPLVFEVRDLWPASAVALGAMRNRRALRLATRLEEACYRRARSVVVVTRGIRDDLLRRGVPPEKVELVENGSNVEEFDFVPSAREATRDSLGAGVRFVCLYAGIHGLAQGLETVAAAARLLPDVLFVFAGEGPRKPQLAAAVADLPNVRVLGERPRGEMPALLSAADAVLVPLRDLPIFRGALPSKMFDAWACRRPVVAGIEGEAREVIAAARGGIAIRPEDPASLADAISRLAADPSLARELGENGRRYTEERHSRRVLAARFADCLVRAARG